MNDPNTTPAPAATVAPKVNPNKAAFLELAEAYPELFNLQNAKPLAVGIHHELAALGTLSKTKIRRGLGFYVRQRAYLKTVASGGIRHGLQGPNGEVSESESEHAKQQLAELEQRLKERRATSHKAQRSGSKKKAPAQPTEETTETHKGSSPTGSKPQPKPSKKPLPTDDPGTRLNHKLAQLSERFGKDKQN